LMVASTALLKRSPAILPSVAAFAHAKLRLASIAQ